MPLPPWIADQPQRDNWHVVSQLRSRTEAVPSISDSQSSRDDATHAIKSLDDNHHDF
jgi:hypothetical protein